jgi:hypothetical protein
MIECGYSIHAIQLRLSFPDDKCGAKLCDVPLKKLRRKINSEPFKPKTRSIRNTQMVNPCTKKAAAIAFAVLVVGCGAMGSGGGGGGARIHTATQGQPITPVVADRSAGVNQVTLTESVSTRNITGNGIPDHLVGAFPNPGNPNSISAQNVSLSVPLVPIPAVSPQTVQGWAFGVSVNGIVLDPFAGEFWQGDRRSGWNYDALGGAVALGVDTNYAHVQPEGTYHYHGVPFGLLELLRYDAGQHSPLVGYAADGYPIYALTGVIEGALTQVTSSHALKSGIRPGGDQPSGAYDGAFVQDYEYIAGSGTLDQCNGAFTQSAEFPGGTYAYFLTTEYPFIPRCFTGEPDAGFRKGR